MYVCIKTILQMYVCICAAYSRLFTITLQSVHLNAFIMPTLLRRHHKIKVVSCVYKSCSIIDAEISNACI